uniref:ZP domain-containing protein n=1 Tax=Steinernema glaseri TaxID=37863 RepID=A0A1I8AP99_9BILA
MAWSDVKLTPLKDVLKRQPPLISGQPFHMQPYNNDLPKSVGDPWHGAYSKHGFWYKFRYAKKADYDYITARSIEGNCNFLLYESFDLCSKNATTYLIAENQRNEIVGCVSKTVSNNEIAVIGSYFVDENYRHSGIGLKLMHDVMKDQNMRYIFHSPSHITHKVHDHIGLNPLGKTWRFQRVVISDCGAVEASDSVNIKDAEQLLGTQNEEFIFAFDSRVCGYSRAEYLKCLMNQEFVRSKVYCDNNEVSGFCVATEVEYKDDKELWIGPWYGVDEVIAEKLLLSVLSSFKSNIPAMSIVSKLTEKKGTLEIQRIFYEVGEEHTVMHVHITLSGISMNSLHRFSSKETMTSEFALLSFCLILSALVPFVAAIPVDNGVEGDPEIECGGSAITINFNTQNTFEGHVYVKGLYNEPGCRSDESGRQVAGITLPFDSCNVARTRSLNPRGIFVSTTVVISFHPNFVTKVDRAYKIQCFYMEADKTVSAQIEVSDLTTAFQSQVVPMPICRYDILSGGPTGEPVQFAQIGEQVYHKWTCDTETTDTFCMVVHSCFVDDGNGDIVNVLNENGCALDKYILNNLEYPSDLMAGQEAHVYKYADRSQLFYQCQITISIKDPGVECARPQCEEPIGRGAGVGGPSLSAKKEGETSVAAAAATTRAPVTTAASRPRVLRRRFRRDAPTWREHAAGTMDVRTEINALDIIELPQSFSTPANGLHQLRQEQLNELASNRFCLEKTYFSVSVALVMIVVLASSTVSAVLIMKRKVKVGL